jgi:hypothetical protein
MSFRAGSIAAALVLLLGLLGPRPVSAAAPAGEGSFPRRGPKNAANYSPVEDAGRRAAAGPQAQAVNPAPPPAGAVRQAGAPADGVIRLVWAQIVAPNYDQYDIMISSNNYQVYNLTNSATNDITPRLSIGAAKIAFSSDRGDTSATHYTNIYNMNVDGSGVTRLTNVAANEYSPAWSPDNGKIVFQSARDGNFEVYVMNADGSNLVRLTNNPDFDGEPYWARDGSKIVFSSYRNGGYRIWSMNPDGSEQTQLSGQRYSENPVISADGNYVAYDCDDDGDLFYETWAMAIDGSDQALLMDDSTAGQTVNYDDLASGWAADGRIVMGTQVRWELHTDTWYWNDASTYFAYYPYSSHWFNSIATRTSFWPDQQTDDITPPTLGLSAPPAVTANPFTISWTIGNPDSPLSAQLQMKDGAGGAWTTLQGYLNYTVDGVGGHTYFFRIRACDPYSNCTAWQTFQSTVENLAPVTAFTPLGEYTPPDQWTLNWGGTDPGGSGITTYDVQVRNVAQSANWTDLLMTTTATSRSLSDLPKGVQYAFRVRARDRAQNLEDWPVSKLGDTFTSGYGLHISGTIFDQTGLPVPGVLPVTDPSAFTHFLSDPLGAFTAYAAQTAAAVGFTLTKSGYGTLPTTTALPVSAAAAYTAQHDAKLPPGDNVVGNPGLEFLSAAQAPWQTSGVRLPVRTTEHFSGVTAVQLGSASIYSPAETLAARHTLPAALVDSQGRLHVVLTLDGQVYYQARAANGTWSSPIRVSVLTNAAKPQVLQTADGVLHAFWITSENTYSFYKLWTSHFTPGDSTWYPAQLLGNGGGLNALAVAQDGAGGLHAAWASNLAGSAGVWYTALAAGGTWSAAARLDTAADLDANIQAAVDTDGGVHLLYARTTDHGLYHLIRPSGGAWTASTLAFAPAQATTFNTPIFNLLSDGAGGLYAAWGDYWPLSRDCRLAHWTTADGWTLIYTLADTYQVNLRISSGPALHLMITPMNASASQYSTSADGVSWSKPASLPGLALDYLVRAGGAEAVLVDAAAKQAAVSEWDGSAWSAAAPVGALTYTGEVLARLLPGPGGSAHLLWSDNPGAPSTAGSLYYAFGEALSAGGVASLAQQIALPAGMAHPILSYMLQYHNHFPEVSSPFSVRVEAAGGATTLVSSEENTSGWTLAWFDLTPWAGQTVTLAFEVALSAGYRPAAAWVDDVTVGAGQPDLWVDAGSPLAPIYAGEEETVMITYGNRGPAPAEAFTLTAEIPAGLEVVSSTPAGTLVGQTLTWSSATLAALSGTQSVQVVLRAADGSGFHAYTTALSAASATAELEQGNNTTAVSTVVKGRVFLPLCAK